MMKRFLLTGLPILALAGCMVPTGPVEVTRFNRSDQGEQYSKGSYVVRTLGADGKEENSEGLALSPYFAAIRREMDRLGYSPMTGEGAAYIVTFSVSVNERTVGGRSPVSVGVGGSTGGYGSGVGLGLGINLGGGAKQSVVTELSARIRRSNDNQVIWEGRASQQADKKSPAAQPGIAASKLAEALFAGFPGQNGETITVK